MKKYIIYVGEMELPNKNAAAHRVIANCEIIKNSTNHDVVIVGLNRTLINNNIHENNNLVPNFRAFEYKYPSSISEWFRYITSIEYLKEIINKVGINDVEAIIAYNYPAISLYKLRSFCIKHNIKIISDVSEWYGKSKRTFPSNIVKDFDTFLRMRIVNVRCKNLICASKYLEDYYKRNGANVVGIPSLVKKAKITSEINLKRNHKNEFYKTFSFVGSPGKSKEKERIDWIVNFFHSVRDREQFKLILVGVTKESLIQVYPYVKKKIEDLSEQLVFKGRISHHEALKIISESDFTVFARMSNRVTNAGFPTKLAESFSCGTPVITTPSSNVNDYIEDGKSGFVSLECSYNSFKEVMSKAFDLKSSDIDKMKEFINKNNPLSLDKFYDNWRFFYYGEER